MGYPRDQSAVPAAQPVKPMVAAARPRQRCSQPMPFDPEELSQKLAKVLADQRLHAERRRRTRAEATVAAATGSTPAISQAQGAHPPHASLAREYLEKGSLKPGHSITRLDAEPPVVKPSSEKAEPSSARPKPKASDDDRRSSQSVGKGSSQRKGADVERNYFIPQFAAAQFTRTTTAENMSDSKGLVRKLSRTALRLAQGHRERHQERANGQRERMPEIAEMGNARAYGDRNHRHTIEGTLGAGRTAEMRQARGTRPVSTGDLLMAWDSEDPSPCPDDTSDIPAEQNPYEHRVDWTQSDEIQPQPKLKPSLRKADSIWALKNKLGAFTKHVRDENHSRDNSPPFEVSRSPKGGFFSRFKVNH